MTKSPFPALGLFTFASLVACSASKDASDPGASLYNEDSGGGFVLDGGSDGGGLNGEVTPGEGGTVPDCPEELKQVYVVTEGNELYKFEPAKLTFTLIGTLSCPSDGVSTPFSMAVDRQGYGWVLFNDGHLYKVSVKDASCTATSFTPGQHGFLTFGMAFVSDAPGSASETLYVADYNASGIAKIDTSSLKLSFVGGFGGSNPGAGELTGTGDARMFAFFNQTPSSVAELDHATGRILTQKPVPGLVVGSGWAFAHWGGDFLLFTAPSGTSQVTQFNFEKGTSKTVLRDLGYIIVGAGVSTCAPTTRPK